MRREPHVLRGPPSGGLKPPLGVQPGDELVNPFFIPLGGQQGGFLQVVYRLGVTPRVGGVDPPGVLNQGRIRPVLQG